MTRAARCSILLVVLGSLASGPAASALDERTYAYDLSARVLPRDRTELGLFNARLSKTFLPGLQLTSHLAGLLVAPNLYVRWQFLDVPQLAASLDGGVLWASALQVLGGLPGLPEIPFFVAIPVALRGTVPILPDTDLTFAWRFETQIGKILPGQVSGNNTLRFESNFVRTDPSGAWILQFTLPVFVQSATSLASFLGETNLTGLVTLDALPSWSLLVSREFVFAADVGAIAQEAHLRLGGGYRHTPGIMFVESFANVVVVADLFFR